MAYGDAGRAQDAVRAFNRILVLDPTNGLAFQNLAAIALQQALATRNDAGRRVQLQDAESLARKALDADPELPDAYTTLGVVLSTVGRTPEAIDAWKRSVDLDASQFNALYNLWSELARTGRREEAIAYGRRFVATAPPAFFGPDIARVRATLPPG